MEQKRQTSSSTIRGYQNTINQKQILDKYIEILDQLQNAPKLYYTKGTLKTSLDEQNLDEIATRYKEAIKQRHSLQQYIDTMDELQLAQKCYYKHKALDCDLNIQNGTSGCPILDKRIQQQYQDKLNSQFENTFCEMIKEHAIEDAERYEDDFEKTFPLKSMEKEQITRKDSGFGSTLMKTESFVDSYFQLQEKTRLSDDGVLNTAYLETSPVSDTVFMSEKSVLQHSEKLSASPKPYVMNNVGIQVKPNNSSRGIQAELMTEIESPPYKSTEAVSSKSIDAVANQFISNPIQGVDIEPFSLASKLQEDIVPGLPSFTKNSLYYSPRKLPTLFPLNDEPESIETCSSPSKISKPCFPPLSTVVDIPPALTPHLKKLSENYANRREINMAETQSKQAILLSYPIRQRPKSLTSDTIPQDSSGICFNTENMKKSIIPPRSHIFPTSKILNLKHEATGPSNFEISKDSSDDQIFYKPVNDSPKASEILQLALKHNAKKIASSEENKLLYHELSTIEEMDSALTNSPETSMVYVARNSANDLYHQKVKLIKPRTSDAATQYEDIQTGVSKRQSTGNILLDDIVTSPSESDLFQLLSPFDSSSGNNKKTSSSCGDTPSASHPLIPVSRASDSVFSYPSKKSQSSGLMYQSCNTPSAECASSRNSIKYMPDSIQFSKNESTSLQFQSLTMVPNTPSSVQSALHSSTSTMSPIIYKPSPVYSSRMTQRGRNRSSNSSGTFQPLSLLTKMEDSSTLFQSLELIPDDSSSKLSMVNAVVQKEYFESQRKNVENDELFKKPFPPSLNYEPQELNSRSSVRQTPVEFPNKLFSKGIQTSSRSSDENMSQLFTENKIFYRSTPIKEIEELTKEEKCLTEESELTFKEFTITRIESSCNSSLNEKTLVEDVDVPVIASSQRGQLSQSLMSFIAHEKSCMTLSDNNGERSKFL